MSPSESASPASRDRLRFLIGIACLMGGTFIQALDQTIANVALPHMQGGLQADRSEITWVATSYIIAAALTTPTIGWLASRFGWRNLYVVCMTGFTVTSALCGAAQTLGEMVLFRLLQGAFGAALSPLAQSVVYDSFPLEKRARALSWWATLAMVAPVIGPTLGGWLTDTYSWRFIFYINVPLGIIVTLGVLILLPASVSDREKKLDISGFLFFSFALAALQLLLDRGQSNDWFSSTESWIELIVIGIGSYLFIVHNLTSRKRLFPPAMFKDFGLVFGIILTSGTGGILVVTSVLLPPFLQTLGGYSVFQAGLLQAPRGVGTIVSSLLVGRLLSNPNTEPRHLIFVGGSGLVLTLWLMSSWQPDVSATEVAMVTLLQGLSVGMIFVPSSLIAFATLSPALRTDGAAFMSLTRGVIAAAVVSVCTTIIARYSQIMHAYLAEAASPFNRELWVNAPSLFWNPLRPPGAEALNAVIDRNALSIAYSNAFKLMVYLVSPLPFAALIIRRGALLPSPEAIEVME